jgi:hypothetical protein
VVRQAGLEIHELDACAIAGPWTVSTRMELFKVKGPAHAAPSVVGQRTACGGIGLPSE